MPIVLIHAFPLSKEMWKQQAKALAANGFRVILPDLPGFGEYATNTFFSLEEMAVCVIELLDFLNIKKTLIGGLSMGGYVLFNLIRLQPERAAALIFCDTTYQADTDEKINSRVRLIDEIQKQGPIALVENMLPNLISEDTKQNNPDLVNELQKQFLQVNPKAACNALLAMAERKDHLEILNTISVPALLMFGEADQVTNLESAQNMKRLISGSKLEIIEKAGHYSNLEQPEIFNQNLISFSKRINF